MKKSLVTALFLAACTSSPDSHAIQMLQTEQPSIDRVVFATATSIPQNAPPDVTATATGDSARDLYAATLALPELSPGGYSCPADFGIEYSLTFYGGDTQLVTGTVHPSGCEIVTLAATVASASLSPDAGYWSTLAGDLGIAETEIYPYVPTN
jgi:hypothetical protein